MAEVIILPDSQAAGELVASTLMEQIRNKPEFVLGVATGSTPKSTYRALERQAKQAELALDHLSVFALDEYVGLDPQHPQSYRAEIYREVVLPLGLDPARVHVPDGHAEDVAHAGSAFESALATAGGIDTQILGLGRTGHIGFNEPGSSLASRTRIKTLTEETRQDNARFFDSIDEVPTHCLTQGLGTIMEAKHIVLLAFGAEKARPLAASLEGPISARVPGSVLQWHPHVSVVIDEAAAADLDYADYYRHAWANKPTWQGL